MRHWELETVAALEVEVDAKQQQVEKLAEAMLRLANDLTREADNLTAGSVARSAKDDAAERIRETVKEVLGA